jgi:hypothetical protein
MFDVDDREIKKFEEEMGKFAKRAYPHVVRQTLNSAAFGAMKGGRRNIRGEFVNRNRFTERSVLVNPVDTLVVSRMAAFVGSTQGYMRDQETGAVNRSTGRYGTPIPTGYSAGQKGSRPRTRLPRKVFQMRNIRLRGNWERSGKTEGQRIVMTLRKAVETGSRIVFLELANGEKAGIFKVLGGKQIGSRRGPKGAKIRMIQNLSYRSVRIPKHEWLEPAADRERRFMSNHFRAAMVFQIRRQRMFESKRAAK